MTEDDVPGEEVSPVDDPTRDLDHAPRSPADSGPAERRMELHAMDVSLGLLEPLTAAGQARVLSWLAEALGTSVNLAHDAGSRANGVRQLGVTEAGGIDPLMTPKQFIAWKKPRSAAERVACLAYFLSHHRGLEHFKAADIVTVNTEAAAPKFGNASRDLNEADRSSGYLVTAGGSNKQLTPRGEALVEALPDRELAAKALKDHPFKRKRPPGQRRPTTKEEP